MPYPFIESPHFTPADGRAIGVVVIHTMEIAEKASAAEICARWFANPASEVSAHYVSAACRKSDHWDPGPDFPWTRFLRLTRSTRLVEGATKT